MERDTGQALGDPPSRAGDRLFRVSRHPGECRAVAPAREPCRPVAPVRRRLRHDAGDDVRGAGLPGGRRDHDRGHRATHAHCQLRTHRPGGVLFGGPVLPRRLARPAPAAAGHGRAGGARHRSQFPRERDRHFRQRRRGVLRLHHDVRVLPARGALSRDARAPEGRIEPGIPGPRVAARGAPADRISGQSRRRGGAGRHAAGRRSRAGQAGRSRPRGRNPRRRRDRDR